MLTVNEIKAHVLEVTLSGLVEKSDIEKLERKLRPALKSKERIGIVVRIEDWEDMTADAIAEDMKFELAMLQHAAKIAKFAFVSDKQMLEALFRWADPLAPMIEMRTFHPSEMQEARQWVADLPESSSEPEGSGARVIEDGSDGLLVFETNGKISRDEVQVVFDSFDHAVALHGQIELLVKVVKFGGFDLELLGDRDTFASKFGAIGKVRRYAIVGAPGWMRSAVMAMGPLIPIEMRAFEASEEDAARSWVKAA